MKIGFVSTMDHSPWGGSEELWSQAALRLLKKKIAVSARVRKWTVPVPAIEKLERAGCQMIRQPPLTRPERVMRRINKERPFLWLDKVKPDFVVISLPYQFAGLEWMQACARRRIRYAVVVQSAGDIVWAPDEVLRMLRGSFEAAEACFFVSQRNLDVVRLQLATPLPKGEVVRNPFKVPYEPNLNWPPNGKVFRLACVGRLEPFAKGQDILFKVLRSQKWRARPLSISLYGDGANRETLKTLKDEWSLENVTFEGFVHDIPKVWSQNHALVLPSRVEGLPLAVVEAMLCARPCIVTDVGGNSELVEDNISGFIAPAATVDFVDEAMERAWMRRSDWRAMGEQAATDARQLVPSDPAQVFADRLIGLV